MNERILNFSKNRNGFVKCNEGFVLDDPNMTELVCLNGKWGVQKRVFNSNGKERSALLQEPPRCRDIVCRSNPFIPNSRLLKQVGLYYE